MRYAQRGGYTPAEQQRPHPRQILGGATALFDGTIAPAWDWAAIPDLFSGKAATQA